MARTGREWALVATTAVLLAGCGGSGGGGNSSSSGSSSDTDNATGTGGTTGSEVTSGAITAFGSIVVNGRRIETEGPEVEIEQDGARLAASDLELGDQVRVEEDDDGRRIEVDEAVRGPVDSFDPLTVMGQTVRTSPETVFDDSPASDPENLVAGDVVEVHGLRNKDEEITASRVEKESSPEDFEVTGTVQNHQPTSTTFEIGGLTIDYGAASEIDDDLPSGDEWNGLLVEVEAPDGQYMPGPPKTLQASKVDREDPAGATTDQQVEIERLVTAVDGDTLTVSGGLQVDISGAEIKLGTASDLVIGVRIEIEGRLQPDGTLAASEIKFDDNEARLAGRVQNEPGADGNLQVLGVTVVLADNVEFDNDGVASLSDLARNDFVEVEGSVAPSGSVIAHEIERDDSADPDEDRELRGPVSQKDAGARTLEILGISVTIGSGTEIEIDDAVLTRTEFFDRLVLHSSIVNVRWDGASFTGTDDTAERVEIEHEDNDEDEDDDEDEEEDKDEDEDDDEEDDDDN